MYSVGYDTRPTGTNRSRHNWLYHHRMAVPWRWMNVGGIWWLHFNSTASFHDVANCMHQGIDRTGSCVVAPGVCSNSLYQLGAIIVIKGIHQNLWFRFLLGLHQMPSGIPSDITFKSSIDSLHERFMTLVRVHYVWHLFFASLHKTVIEMSHKFLQAQNEDRQTGLMAQDI